jgi:hypothetical protein
VRRRIELEMDDRYNIRDVDLCTACEEPQDSIVFAFLIYQLVYSFEWKSALIISENKLRPYYHDTNICKKIAGHIIAK